MKNEDLKTVHLKLGRVTLDGILRVPKDATAVVLFAHGAGSGRKSPRNNYLAESLHARGWATLLVDLLTGEEAREEALSGHLRFNIGLLTERLDRAREWLLERGGVHWQKLGLFGASTGAAAALAVAARQPNGVDAVVSRGGRPDLAGAALRDVRCPTLLIVGGADTAVLDLNQQAIGLLSCEKRLEIVPGAAHLFEEPGALEAAADLACAWFAPRLAPRGAVAAPWY
jgi:dienelactone hydrolase